MKYSRKQKMFTTSSTRQTHEFGRMIAERICKMRLGKRAVVLGLQGELGSGKTTFAQGFARGLGIKEKVLSPTFVIVKQYEIQDTKYKIQHLYHIDCYRLEKPKELFRLGFKEIICNPTNIVLVEWADRVKTILSRDTAWLRFVPEGKTTRRIHFRRVVA